MSSKDLKPITEPALLIGRETVIEEILNSKNNHAVLGEPKQGKTSLLRCVSSILKTKKLPFFYLDMTFNPKTVDITNELITFMEDEFEHRKIYILIDDFDKIITDNDILHPLRSIGETDNVIYIITSRRPINDFTYLSCSPFSNIFMINRLTNLTFEDTEKLIRMVNPGQLDDSDYIFELTNGHPYLLKLYLNYDDPLQNHDFWLTLDVFFTYCWDQLLPEERFDLINNNYNQNLAFKGYMVNYHVSGLLKQWLQVNEPRLRKYLEEDIDGPYWSAFLRGMEFYQKQLEKMETLPRDLQKRLF